MSKSVSEIIVDLDIKVTKLIGLFQNTDNNLKIALNRLNALERQIKNLKQDQININTSEVVQSSKSFTVPDTQGVIGAPSVSAFEEKYESPKEVPRQSVQTGILQAMPVNRNSAEDDELTEEVIHKGTRRDLRYPANPEDSPRRSVSQKVLFPDGRSVAFAQIEVFNKSGFLVKQTRTSPTGVWQAPLEPGEYKVHLLKRMSADGSKLPVELNMEISVPETPGSHELPSPELPEIYMQGE